MMPWWMWLLIWGGAVTLALLPVIGARMLEGNRNE
jgi:hypothetical protein